MRMLQQQLQSATNVKHQLQQDPRDISNEVRLPKQASHINVGTLCAGVTTQTIDTSVEGWSLWWLVLQQVAQDRL